MPGKFFRIGATAALATILGMHATWAQEEQTPTDETSSQTVSTQARLLKEADDIAFSAQQLQPIALENLPARIDLSTLPASSAPGMAVSSTAHTLRDLDPAEIPGTARTLGGIARSGLPGAAGSHSLPAAAQNHSGGHGHR